jgi:hypothetical protein
MITTGRITVEFIDHKRYAENPADPRFPGGVDIDASQGAAKCCTINLPYPARRCGMHLIHCRTCGFTMALSAAGRADDPRSLKIACRGERT